MNRKISLTTAFPIVLTNMIGIGILTTPGVLSSYLSGGWQIMLVWLAGGGIAFLGATVYGQMGSLMPRSGGEFHYLSRIYHPYVGSVAGWVSIIAGFAGPIALSALAFSKYMLNISKVHTFLGENFSIAVREKMFALILILVLCLFHIFRKRTALSFQVFITFILVAFLLLISFLGYHYSPEAISMKSSQAGQLNQHNFGMALFLVIYSYTGWNASCYFAGDIKNPARNLPLSLFLGVFVVMLLYLAVNYGLLKILETVELSGQIDFLAALGYRLNGETGSFLISVTVLTILLASINSMIYTGSSIPLLHTQHSKNKSVRGSKLHMHIIQMAIAFLFVLFTGFQQLLLFLTVILTSFTILTAFGIFLLPWKRLKVSVLQQVMVKIAAGLLIGILFWLIINSIKTYVPAALYTLGIVLGIVLGMFLFEKLRKRNAYKKLEIDYAKK